MVYWLLFGMIVFVLFFGGRDILCWYWKINKSLENQEKIIGLLQQMTNKTSANEPAVNINYAAFMGEQVQIMQKSGLVLGGKVIQSEEPEKYIALLSDGTIKRIDLNVITNIQRV